MQTTSPTTVATGTTSLIVNFTFTKRNQPIDLSNYSNYIIDINGTIYQNSSHSRSCTLYIVGGDDTFMFDKSGQTPGNYYMSDNQRNTIHSILREMAVRSSFATVDGNSRGLVDMARSTFDVYRS